MKKVTVLCVEGDSPRRGRLSDFLAGSRYEAVLAGSAAAGLCSLDQNRPDVVVCDYDLPDLGAKEFLNRVRASHPDVPIVVVSGRATIARAVEAIKNGAADFLRKPFTTKDMNDSIEKALAVARGGGGSSGSVEVIESVVKERTEELTLAYERLFQLNVVSNEFARIRDEETFYEQVPKLACGALDFDRATLALERDGKLVLRSYCLAKDTPQAVAAFEKLVEKKESRTPPLHLEAFNKNKTIFVSDLAEDPRWLEEREHLSGTRSIVVSPIRIKDAPIGALSGSMGYHDREMNDQDVARFEMFAVMVGLALENIRAHQKMERKIQERTAELEENAIELARANVNLLGAHELLEEKAEELRKAEARMVAIIEASPVPLVVTRLSDGIIFYANRHLCELVGAKPDDLIGSAAHDFYYYPEDRQMVLEILKRDGVMQNHEVLMKRADGSPVWMSFSIVQTELAGEPVIIGGLHDIDERKKAEAALQDREALFRGIVESAHDIIFTLSPDQKFSYISPHVSELLGHAVSDVIGRGVEKLVRPEDLRRLRQLFEELVDAEHHLMDVEFRAVHANGHSRWYSLNAATVRDEQGRPQSIVGIAHDVTDRKAFVEELERTHKDLKNTQSQLVQSEKMAALGTLVAGIAHEINTPIGAVNSMHDTLLRSLSKLREELQSRFDEHAIGRERVDAYFEVIADANKVIRSGIDRVTTIVRRLRSFARLDEAELKKVDINEGIEDTLTLVHHEIKHDITVVKNFGDLPLISCFPGRLNQVFLNLLVNARQAISGKGVITIETKMEERDLVVRFSDTGVGIRKENIGKIFDPGFTTKGVGVGTGLGLSICYRIVQDHQGAISVESEEGKGTTFTVRIPDNLDELYDEGGTPKRDRNQT